MVFKIGSRKRNMAGTAVSPTAPVVRRPASVKHDESLVAAGYKMRPGFHKTEAGPAVPSASTPLVGPKDRAQNAISAGVEISAAGVDSQVDRFNPVIDDMSRGSVVEDWIPRDIKGQNRMFRIAFARGIIEGPAVETIAEIAWSDFELTGVADNQVLDTFYAAKEAVHVERYLEDISKEMMVMGRCAIQMVLNPTLGVWSDMLIHDSDYIKVTPIPRTGYMPKIDLLPSPDIQNWARSSDPRDVSSKKGISQEMLKQFQSSSAVSLDPLVTAYIPRRAYFNDMIGTSYYVRLIPIWAVEKSLINATVTGHRRRAGPITHIKAGSETWKPTTEEMEAILNAFVAAEEDSVSAVVITRQDVDANAMRGGSGEIWKWSDEWGWLQEAKLRALGFSESLLSGDACMVGSTLVATTDGILSLGSIRNKEDGKWQDVALTTGSRYGRGQAVKWHYNGTKPTKIVKTETGNGFQSSHNHRALVFNPADLTTDYKRADELQVGDQLCVSTEKVVRTRPLKLPPLRDPVQGKRAGRLKTGLKKPKTMTPDLAYLMGLIISEGSFSDENRCDVYNNDPKLIRRLKSLWKSVFGLDSKIEVRDFKRLGWRWSESLGKEIRATKAGERLHAASKSVVGYLNQLGVYTRSGRVDDRTPSWHKVIPWSVLQADEQSQLAFMAAYVEGDGSVSNGRVALRSYSAKLLEQFQVMLNAHGLCSRISGTRLDLSAEDSQLFWAATSKYRLTKKLKARRQEKARNSFGFPMAFVREELKKRFVSKTNKGTTYKTDDGRDLLVGSIVKRWGHWFGSDICFLYDKYDRGSYDTFLADLKKISPKLHARVKQLLDLRYRFSIVTSVEDGKAEDVFDLSMAKGTEPAYVANGIVVHNTINQLDQAMTIFMERIKAHRKYITEQFLLQKFFRALSHVHGFRKRTSAQLDHRIRVNNDEHQLILPTIQFKKQLEPAADQQRADLLGTLEEKGVPVGLRDWSVALGGGDPSAKLGEMREDLRLRAKVARVVYIKNKINELVADGGSAESSTELLKQLKDIEKQIDDLPFGDGDSTPGADANADAHEKSGEDDKKAKASVADPVWELETIAADPKSLIVRAAEGVDWQEIAEEDGKRVHLSKDGIAHGDAEMDEHGRIVRVSGSVVNGNGVKGSLNPEVAALPVFGNPKLGPT